MASSEDKSQRLQSNEEVIEELTKDLESSCIRVDNSSDTNARAKGDPWDIVNKECKEDSNDNVQNIEEDVNEELLKDRDLLLTESEQEVCP